MRETVMMTKWTTSVLFICCLLVCLPRSSVSSSISIAMTEQKKQEKTAAVIASFDEHNHIISDVMWHRMEAEIRQLKNRVRRLESLRTTSDCCKQFPDATTAAPGLERQLNRDHEAIFQQLNETINNKEDDYHQGGGEMMTMEMASDDPREIASSSVSGGGGSGDSWAKLQISPDNIGSMQYGNMVLKIYQHASNQQKNADASLPSTSPLSGAMKKSSLSKYYYAPITLMDHRSARSSYNNVTKQAEMEFRVEMWNDDVKTKVAEWIKANHDTEVNENFVQVIPFEKMVLATTSISFQQRYTLSKDWKNYQSQKDVRFKLSCATKKDCDHLANEMRQSASQFSDFQILFSLASQSSQTKQTVILVESILEGGMGSKLNQQMPPGTEFALVTAEDEQQLLQESATNILIDTFDDSTDVVSSNSEAQIYKFLKNLLTSSRTTIDKQSDSRIWNSVFWNDDNYRPDRTSKTLNDLYNKQDKETQKKMVVALEQAQKESFNQEREKGPDSSTHSNSKDEQNRDATTYDNSTSIGGSVGGGFGGFSVNAGFNKDQKNSGNNEKDIKKGISGSNSTTSGGQRNTQAGNKELSIATSLTQEQLDKLFEESKKNVEWDGEKFTPKQLSLTKINLAKLRDAQTFRDRSVRVRYSTAVLSVAINIPDDSDITSTNKFIEIQDQLQGLKTASANERNEIETQLKDLETRFTEQFNAIFINLRKDTNALGVTVDGLVATVTQMQSHLKEFTSKTADQLTGLQIRSEEWKVDGDVIWADDCDFNLQDIGRTLKAKKEDCGNICLANPECDHFTWNGGDGTCWIKKWSGGRLRFNVKGLRCGFIPSRATADANALGATVAGLVATVTHLQKPVTGPMPTGCADLKRLGHLMKNGFYTAKSPSSNKLHTVYCDFTIAPESSGYETVVGYLDVKTYSSGVSFNVQRSTKYSTEKSAIPYEVTELNIGNAMDTNTGIFKAPVNGRYHFSFTAITTIASLVSLYKNSRFIGISYAAGDGNNMPLMATLNLKKGDTVHIKLVQGSIFDDSSQHTQFSGFLLDEDLSL